MYLIHECETHESLFFFNVCIYLLVVAHGLSLPASSAG